MLIALVCRLQNRCRRGNLPIRIVASLCTVCLCVSVSFSVSLFSYSHSVLMCVARPALRAALVDALSFLHKDVVLHIIEAFVLFEDRMPSLSRLFVVCSVCICSLLGVSLVCFCLFHET